MSKLVKLFVVVLSVVLGGCVTSRDWARSLDNAATVGVNAAVGAAAGAIAGGVVCSKGDRNCRGNYTGAGMAVGAAVGLGDIAEQERQRRYAEYQRSIQQPVVREHCEQVWNGQQWIYGNCVRSVDQTTIGQRPGWVPR